MSDFIIKAENLGKKYVIGHQTANGRYVALRDVVAQNVRSLWRMTKDMAQGKPIIMGNEFEEVWALKDVNFEIQRGEVVGIIGRNGAGKSTLLKVLSRITEPSVGRVTIKGRVASLLEVGTGFHPELTGRENIYLNGAILGMTRAEVKRKFDEIVAFAEVEKFLDTPVKRYSSGMYVRLAFAVAAHLEPEILVVDEVLAVGDAAFQKKCLGKMGDVARAGRTVLFVSHNMAAIQNLCERAFLFESGFLEAQGSVTDVIELYFKNNNSDELDGKNISKTNGVRIQLLVRSDNQPNHLIVPGNTIEFLVHVSTDNPIPGAGLGIGITDLRGQRLVTLHTHYQTTMVWSVEKQIVFKAAWNDNFLCPGKYLVTISVFDGPHTIANWTNAGSFSVAPVDYFNTGKLPDTRYQGHMLARATWLVEND